MTERDLTDKQRLFAEHYLQTLNATEAARAAGYKGSYGTLRMVGSRNLTKDNIKAYIEERIKPTIMQTDEVLERLSEQARASLGDFLEIIPGTGFARVNMEKAADKLHLIRNFRIKDGNIVEVDLHNSQTALVTLAKIHGLLTEKTEHTGEVTIRIVEVPADDSD
ncbi:hypothetical protein GF380_03230 [Candidatus Uhrbacteria bacterium]|nr:hypothetical protein [Candidatus Uhrbacteria bacterium]